MRYLFTFLLLVSCAKKKIEDPHPIRPTITLDEEEMEEFPEAGEIHKRHTK
jgi:hypothetical protein